MTGITWNWADAGRGLAMAAPALPIALATNVSFGAIFALATLPVAMLGIPPARRARLKLMVASFVFAVPYAAGCVIGEVPPLAVAALFAVAYGSVLAAARRPVAVLLPALAAPAFALGMNEPVPDGLALAAMFLAGGACATLVSLAWPEAAPPKVVARGPFIREPRLVHTFATLFATAGAVGVAIGYALDLSHPAWAGAAAMFIMRPEPDLLISRAVGRACATIAGVLLAALLFRRDVGDVVIAIVAVCGVTAAVAVHTSRWYVTSAGTGLVVVLMSGVSSTEAFHHAFGDRIVETIIGAALALLLGIGVPRIVRLAH